MNCANECDESKNVKRKERNGMVERDAKTKGVRERQKEETAEGYWF